MKGILLKELYNLKTYKKTLVALILLYAVVTFAMQDSSALMSILIVMAAVMSMALFSYDETCRWDTYALSLPVRRGEIVLARYITMLGLTGLFAVLAVLFTLVVQILRPLEVTAGNWAMIKTMCVVAVLLLSVLVPLGYKLGAEKARVAMLVLVFVPTIGGMLLSKADVALPSGEVVEIFIESVLPVISIAAIYLSYLLSRYIYQKKEF